MTLQMFICSYKQPLKHGNALPYPYIKWHMTSCKLPMQQGNLWSQLHRWKFFTSWRVHVEIWHYQSVVTLTYERPSWFINKQRQLQSCITVSAHSYLPAGVLCMHWLVVYSSHLLVLYLLHNFVSVGWSVHLWLGNLISMVTLASCPVFLHLSTMLRSIKAAVRPCTCTCPSLCVCEKSSTQMLTSENNAPSKW